MSKLKKDITRNCKSTSYMNTDEKILNKLLVNIIQQCKKYYAGALGWDEMDNRGWDGWMASPTWWTWIWPSYGSWWWTGKPGVLQSMGLQRVEHEFLFPPFLLHMFLSEKLENINKKYFNYPYHHLKISTINIFMAVLPDFFLCSNLSFIFSMWSWAGNSTFLNKFYLQNDDNGNNFLHWIAMKFK